VSAALMVLSGWQLAVGNIPAGYWLLGSSLFLVNLGYILDVADGSVARMTGASSSSGYFLDYVFHLIFHPMYLCSIGMFLYLVSGWIGYLVVGVLSICSGWGASFSAKEHVLCEHVAKNSVDMSKFTDDDRYYVFVDSVKTRKSVEQKRGFLKLCINLAIELLLFPGQYTTFSIVILADTVLRHHCGWNFILLKFLYLLLAVITLCRVPFRVAREYRTLVKYDSIRGTQP
jgi:phosphatidylglycerophosphate synthase